MIDRTPAKWGVEFDVVNNGADQLVQCIYHALTIWRRTMFWTNQTRRKMTDQEDNTFFVKGQEYVIRQFLTT